MSKVMVPPALAGRDTEIDWRALATALLGDLLEPGDPGYEDARAIWNGMIDRQPAAIALCVTADDVAMAVAFARDRGVPFSIRGGGHNIAGTALCDGGLTISLARMDQVEVDLERGLVTVGPGANWADVDRATQPHGLVVPGGVVSTTGVAGYTLGGGFGWLTRRWGYTSDLLRQATVVTADGKIRTVSAEAEPDLFWAIRGGGGNFGVVTEFVFEAKPLGPEVAAGMVLWPLEQARQVMDHFRQITATAPVELTSILLMRTAPAAPFLPETIHGQPVVGIAACFAGPVAQGMAALDAVRRIGTPVADTIKPKPFSEHQAFLDAGQPYGRRYYWKSAYLPAFTERVQETFLTHVMPFTSPFSSMLLPHLGGNAKANRNSAVSHRDAEFLVNFQASWETPAEDDRHIAWARKNADAMLPEASGHYVNFMTEDEVTDASRLAYAPETLAALGRIKQAYDPQNLFRLNKNILPANG